MSNAHLQVKNTSVLTDKFKEVLAIPEDASDIQIQVGIHATKVSYKVPFVQPSIVAPAKVKPVAKKKTVKKKFVVKKDD